MLATYRAVFRLPGTAAFCSAGFLMRISIAVYPIAMLLLVSSRTHHYGFAGVLSGAYILGGVPGNPVGARLVDRFGQHRILPPSAALHIVSVAALVTLAELHAPDPALLPAAFFAGFSYLSVGSLVRARWSYVLAGRPELTTAYGLESALDELIFVLGPLVATVLSTTVDPVVPIVLAVVLTGCGSFALWRLRATEPPAHPVGEAHPASALRSRGMVSVLCVSISMGAVFASAEVTVVAFCGQHGRPGLAGLVLAAIALGSGLSGLFYGARAWRSELLTRFRLQAILFGALTTVLLLAVNIGVLALLGFVLGLAISPTLITTLGLISRIVPVRALTEGLAWLTTGLNLGYGIGSALAGWIADAHGARPAFLVTIGAGVLVAGFGVRVHAVLSRTPVEQSNGAAIPR